MKKLLTKILGSCLGFAMAIGIGVAAINNKDIKETRADSVVLEFGFSSNVSNWPTSESSTAAGNKTYKITQGTYTFNLGPKVYCNTSYLMLKYTTYLGLPAIADYKLTKVVAHSSTGHSTKTYVGISTSSSSATYATGGASQNWSTHDKDYTYNLSSTAANTVYYVYVTSANSQLTKLTLTYESSSGGGGGSTTDDTITASDLKATNTTYTSFSGVTKTSSAVYLGKTAKDSSGNIQINTTANNGIATSTSGGIIKSISVSWGSTPASGRGFTIRASDTAYTSSNLTTNGTSVGDLTASTTTLTIVGTYHYVSVSGKGGAVYATSITFSWDSAPSVSISTSSKNVTRDGTANQTIAFTATCSNFSDDEEDIAYEWRSSNTSAISVTSVGSESTANLKVVGAGNTNITVYALGLSGDEATSAAVAITVTNETYSGTLTIDTGGDLLTDSIGTLEYTLTGNTHTLDTFVAESSDDDVIAFDGLDYITGSTPDATAEVTLTASSSVYTLEVYVAHLTVTLLDANAVTSITTNIETRNPKIGGNNLSFVATVHLRGGGDATGKQVKWTPADTGVCTINASQNTLTGTIVPVNVGTTTVRIASVDDETVYHDVTVNVQGPDSKTLNSITITKGDGAVTSYYDDDTEVNTTGLSLTANFVNETYPSYSENVAVAVNASGVVWTLDLTNEKVKVAYTVNEITVYDDFSITVGERPTSVTFLATDHTDFADGKVYTLTPFTISVTNYVQTPTDNAPIYNSTNEDVRLYNGDYFEITCDNTVETIDSIEYVYTTKDSGKGDSYTLTLNDGDTSSSYTKSGTTLTFTNTTKIRFTAGANQIRFKSFTINYTKVAAQDLDVESVDIADSSISIESGDTYNLTVSVLPVNARDISVTWESDDTSVAEVDKNGLVTGVAPGTCTITATSKDQPSIYDTCSVTVTAGPKVNHTFLSSVDSSSGSILDLNGTDFTLTKTGGSYTGYDAVRGAQFSSGSDSINVQLQSTDIAFATKNLKVIAHASKAGSNTGSIKAYLGTTQIGSTGTLTTSDTEFTFEYSGAATSTVTLSDLLKIELDNTGGAVYIKSIKVYSDATASNIENFMNSQLHMNTYDKDGTYGSTAGDGSCKTWWNDVVTAYSNLTAGQKTLFTTEDKYTAAVARLSEWARINNYSFNTETGALVQNARVTQFGIINVSSFDMASIIVIISMISIAAVGGYFFLRKRKED